jgi:hypothetical protein
MKKLIIVASLLCCNATYARPIAVTPNTIGGYTILDNMDCKTNPKHLQAYATDAKDNVIEACWYLEGNDIVFIPKSGILRRTPLDRFEIIFPQPVVSKKTLRT